MMRKIIACTAAALACAFGAAAAAPQDPVGAPEWRGFDLSLVAVSPAESGEPDSAACRIDGAGPTLPAPGDDAAASAFAARFGGAKTTVLVAHEVVPLGAGPVVVDAFAQTGGSGLYVGLRGPVPRGEQAPIVVTLQWLTARDRAAEPALTPAAGRPAWFALFAENGRTCLVGRIELLDAPPAAPAADAVPAVFDGRSFAAATVERAVEAEYPRRARDEKREGSAAVRVAIGRDGRAAYGRLLACSAGGEELALAAFDAVVDWRWRPARLDGKPVESWTTLKFGFHLPKEDAK